MTLIIRNMRKPLYHLRYIIILWLLFLYVLITVRNKPPPISQLQVQPQQTKTVDNQSQLANCKRLCASSSIFTNTTLRFNSLYIIRHFPQFVCPQNFRNLADWVYGWPNQYREQMKVTTNQIKLIAPCLPSGSIIYVRQWAMANFFEYVYPHLQNNFVLVTGESDATSPSHLEILEAPDSKIIHWFGQNGQYDTIQGKNKKFTHLPIGINCFEMANTIQGVHSQHPNHRLPSIFNDSDELSGYIQPLDISYRALAKNISNKDLVLINFDPNNDGTGLRRRIIKNMCPQSETNGHKYSFAKCFSKPSGVQVNDLPKIYIRNRQYPFWLSPRGSGYDCHRTWEALYLDIIPIVWNSSLNILYENLPVVIINNYEELNETFLYTKLNEISKNKVSKEKIYEYEKLRNAYWRRLILDKSRHKNEKNILERRNQCWKAKYTIN